MNVQLNGAPLSAFSCELLLREYEYLADAAAFGRLAQEVIVAALKRLYLGLHDNRGAGTPDCRFNDGTSSWAWEIKHTNGQAVNLGPRDIRGLKVDAASSESRPRLVVLDVRFPARLWVFDATSVDEGPLVPDAHADLHQHVEATNLTDGVDRILRNCDVDLLGPEIQAKSVVQERARFSGEEMTGFEASTRDGRPVRRKGPATKRMRE